MLSLCALDNKHSANTANKHVLVLVTYICFSDYVALMRNQLLLTRRTLANKINVQTNTSSIDKQRTTIDLHTNTSDEQLRSNSGNKFPIYTFVRARYYPRETTPRNYFDFSSNFLSEASWGFSSNLLSAAGGDAFS